MRSATQFCPGCGESLIPSAVAPEHRVASVSRTRFIEHWGELKRVGWLFGLLLATSFVFGIGAPRGTSPEIVGTLNKEINAALAEPGMMARFGELGGIALPGSPADFAKLIADETEKWAKVIRVANIKPE